MDPKIENVYFKDRRGEVRGPFEVYNEDPKFTILNNNSGPWDHVFRGHTLVRHLSNGRIENRHIFAVSWYGAIMFPSLEIIAPKQVVKPGSEKRFARDRAFSWNPTAEEMPPILDFRPGTTIMGGRDSGFYDSEGIIIEAEHTGGDPKREEDWLFRVIAKTTDGEWLGPYWILLCDVGFPITEPEWLWEFPLEPSKPIDELLAAGEQELFEYFASHPKELVNLSPRRFEELVLAIYRNLGFATERVGAWNQQDGGVDLLAVSRTEAGTEFRIAIQCKTSGRKISARPIRELAGVLGVFHAHQGVVATTSAFTGPARKEVEGSLWQISLQDKDDLYRRILSILVPDLKL